MNKIDHIPHLEDLLILRGTDALNDIIDVLYYKDSFSIKYDGAPAVLFGTCPTENKFFVATKSFFNKTPKINYNVEDITRNHGKSPELVNKLTYIFPLLEDLFHNDLSVTHQSSIIQGDLLFLGSNLDGTNTFTPNTITYKFDSPHRVYYDIGIALHTHYDTQLKSSTSISDNVLKTPQLDRSFYAPQTSVSRGRGGDGKLSSFLYSLANFNRCAKNFKPDPKNVVLVNKLIRNNEELTIYNLQDIFNNEEFVILYLKVKAAKEFLISMLDKTYGRNGLIKSINDVSCGHEGFVTRLNDNTPVKLVNRKAFSYANFERHS